MIYQLFITLFIHRDIFGGLPILPETERLAAIALDYLVLFPVFQNLSITGQIDRGQNNVTGSIITFWARQPVFFTSTPVVPTFFVLLHRSFFSR